MMRGWWQTIQMLALFLLSGTAVGFLPLSEVPFHGWPLPAGHSLCPQRSSFLLLALLPPSSGGVGPLCQQED